MEDSFLSHFIFYIQDAVSVNRKDEARQNAVKFLSTYQTQSNVELGVRINSVSSGFLG